MRALRQDISGCFSYSRGPTVLLQSEADLEGESKEGIRQSAPQKHDGAPAQDPSKNLTEPLQERAKWKAHGPQ